MLQRRPYDHPPWPAAPRPFVDEAMGSWVGRVAARYKISVAQLDSDYELQLPTQASAIGWLMMPSMPDESLKRVADLARVNIGDLRDIQTSQHRACTLPGCAYCYRCLVLNPVDVASPYWRRQWFRSDFSRCPLHPEPLQWLSAGGLHACRNFAELLRLACRKHRQQELLHRFQPH